MKMILLVPDGVGIRNYIFSSFIRNFIIDGNEVLVYHRISKSAIEEIQMNKSDIRDF
jgi:predicted RNA-binding protein with PUA-like domain